MFFFSPIRDLSNVVCKNVYYSNNITLRFPEKLSGKYPHISIEMVWNGYGGISISWMGICCARVFVEKQVWHLSTYLCTADHIVLHKYVRCSVSYVFRAPRWAPWKLWWASRMIWGKRHLGSTRRVQDVFNESVLLYLGTVGFRF